MNEPECWYQEMVELRKRADDADRACLELIRERDGLREMVQVLRYQMQADADLNKPAQNDVDLNNARRPSTVLPFRALRSNWDVV